MKKNRKAKQNKKLFWKADSTYVNVKITLLYHFRISRRILTTFWYLLQLKMPDHVARAFQCVIIAAKIWLQGWFIITSPPLDWWTFAPVESCSKFTGTSCVRHVVTIWSIPTPQIHSPFWALACCFTEKQALTKIISFSKSTRTTRVKIWHQNEFLKSSQFKSIFI